MSRPRACDALPVHECRPVPSGQAVPKVTDNGDRSMRIHAPINERTVRRTFRERKIPRGGLTVVDRDFPDFGLRVPKNGKRTFIVSIARQSGPHTLILGTTDEITAAEARKQATAAVQAAGSDGKSGPLFADFAEDFLRRQGRRWKPSTRKG
ncbi:DUF4102 domain-containing protein, partial [Candidatus Poribacteria bacterium]|nr:DUF4102 domain-containing protein [Candidatus Poribacteria bacterium]